jgi:ribose transport system substrate-binding protein
LTAVAVFAAACGSGDDESGAGTVVDTDPSADLSDVEIGLVSINAASPGVKLYSDVVVELAEERGWTIRTVDTAGDIVAAQNQLKEWIAQDFDALVIDTIPNEALTDAVAEANAAGIPWFSVASGVVDGITNEVTANEEVSGTALTEAFVELLEGSGRVVKLNWTGLEATRTRDEAFHAVVEQYPDIEVAREVELAVPGWNEDAYNQMTNILTAETDIRGVWLGWDDFAPDVVRAIEQAGLEDQIVVAGFDLDPAAADLLRANGPFQMTNALPIPDEARWTVEAIETVLSGGTVDTLTYVDNCLATPDNIPAEGGRESEEFWQACKG